MGSETPAAVLIDFENIYYFLKNLPDPPRDVVDSIIEILTKLKRHLLTTGERVLSMDAYADFDRIEETPQSQLYLLGVETHNVLGRDHKNAADMRLSIDTLDIYYNRPDIRTFVFVAGDRDYIPVVQYLLRRGKIVRVVGFPKQNVAGDLMTIVGEENFLDAKRFVSKPEPAEIPPAPAAHAAVPKTAPAPGWKRPEQDELGIDWPKYEEMAIQAAFTHYGDKREIWLVPYLFKLRDSMPQLSEPERKQLIARLERRGAWRVERRQGETHEFSVLLVNWNSESVKNSYPG